MQVIPPALRGLGVGRIRPPNLVPQIVAAIVAAQQPVPIAAPAPVQPNNDAIIAAILAMQQPPAVVAPPPPAAPPAAPNNDIAIIAAILAMQQQPPPAPPIIEPEPVVIAKKPHVYDPDLDCVGNENDNDIGCVPNI